MYQELGLLRPEMLDFYAHYMCNLKKSISSFSGPRLWGSLMKPGIWNLNNLKKKRETKHQIKVYILKMALMIRMWNLYYSDFEHSLQRQGLELNSRDQYN